MFVGYACLVCFVISLVDANFYANKTHDYGGVRGEVMIGGLVAVHDDDGGNNVNCNVTDVSLFGIQRVEAMRYAVHKINSNKDILPGVTFGIEIRDSCGSETRALDQSLQFVIDRVPTVCQKKTNENTMFGVVGASTSLITAEVANLLRLFRIPLVSYAATSTELSDKAKYTFLLRTIPPDSMQSMAMSQFITDILGWQSVFVLYSAGSYGEHGHDAFLTAARRKNICVVDSAKILPGISVDKMIRILNSFRENEKNVFGIVAYCELHDIRTIIEALEKDSNLNSFRLIGSDNFILGPRSNRSVIFSLHYDEKDLADFHKNWYSKVTRRNTAEKENPWLHSYWNKHCNESENGECFLCSYNITDDSTDCPRDDKLSYTIDAVYSFAYAIHNALWNGYAGNLTKLLSSIDLKSDNFLRYYLKNISFEGLSGFVSFPENDSIARGFYDINQFDAEGNLKVLGTWNRRNLTLMDDIEKKFFGSSTCQHQCQVGEKRVRKIKACCWDCEKCKDGDYLKTKYECERCALGQKPNKTRNGCYQLPLRHITTLWKVILYTLTCLGILATVFTIKTLICHNDTPLVKASGRELTYILLFGILMLFSMSFMLLVYPGVVVCGIARFGIGFCLCLCYGSLLVKTNRIARIFSGRQDLLFLTPNWQVILTCLLIMPQILIGVIGLIQDPPKREFDHSFKNIVFIKCNSETVDLIGAIAYNLVLVFLSTYYAFRTRKVPANFNEARYIGFVMYTTCVIWLAFLPVFFGTNSEYRTIFLMLDMIMNAATLLIGLFGIKIYIILLRPDKNSRSYSKTRSITFYSHDSETVNGSITVEAQKDGVEFGKKDGIIAARFKKSSTDTSLVPYSDFNNTNELSNGSITKAELELMRTKNRKKDSFVPNEDDRLNMNDVRGEDAPIIISSSRPQLRNHLSMPEIELHERLKKTLTM